MSYVPHPYPTEKIELPADLESLMEALAENTHEVWSAGRIREGWTYGPQRDDTRRTHPGLVPYDQLSFSEQEYDRNTAKETLRFILAHGYRIEKREDA